MYEVQFWSILYDRYVIKSFKDLLEAVRFADTTGGILAQAK